jgi:hypothetical protein
MSDLLRSEGDERVLTESEVIPLLRTLCVDLGFCFHADVAEKFETDPPRSIEAFTRAVFEAEGMHPDHADRKLYAQVSTVVAKAFQGSAPDDV